MTKVIVAGASGRMGQRICYMVQQHPDLTLAGAFEQASNPNVGKDAGEIAGIGTTGVIIADSLEAVINDGEVIIDFTFHKNPQT
ncbi:MAG: 4-hydroxy-tetrahydrodipicolinate reductase, partial [Candidatus Electrothrix sp. AUS4]|nr:4-hydroxy-tetrahydrodipicolinate reductase [Candidatus Electrothrix sp. AUS4]